MRCFGVWVIALLLPVGALAQINKPSKSIDEAIAQVKALVKRDFCWVKIDDTAAVSCDMEPVEYTMEHDKSGLKYDLARQAHAEWLAKQKDLPAEAYANYAEELDHQWAYFHFCTKELVFDEKRKEAVPRNCFWLNIDLDSDDNMGW